MLTFYIFTDERLTDGWCKPIVHFQGWKLDWKRFRIYLADKFRVSKAFIFIGYIKENERLYQNLKKYGYNLVFKPTIKDQSGKPKGNIDAELVLHSAAIEYPKYDKAVIVSGDGDFRCLHEYLIKKGKLSSIIIPNSKSASTLLRDFETFKVFIEFEKNKLEYKHSL